MGRLLSLFRRQPKESDARASIQGSLLPTPEHVAPCLFSVNGEIVHAMCRIEERDETSVLLRVLRELGKVTLAKLEIGASGQLEVADHLIPMRILRVHLPWIVVILASEQHYPSQRQFFRVPASFSVRLRRSDLQGPWSLGRGLDMSSEGFGFALQGNESPQLRSQQLIELTLNLTATQKEVFEVTAEVRRVSITNGEIAVGVRVLDPGSRKHLANTVSRLQRLMIRQPEDYLLTEIQRPRLRY